MRRWRRWCKRLAWALLDVLLITFNLVAWALYGWVLWTWIAAGCPM